MDQNSFGVVGSAFWIRLHRMQRASTAAGLTVLVTGCVATASVPIKPGDAKSVTRDHGLETDYSPLPRDPASPGPSVFSSERRLTPFSSYSDDYWTALSDLDLTALRSTARTEPEIDFAKGITLLSAGDHEKAESTFTSVSRQAIDIDLAVAAQIMLARTLLYERKWTTLRDLALTSSLAPADRENTADLEKWGHAFANVEQQTTSLPQEPVSLRLRITAVGTPSIRVRINGKEYDFWIDTGSSMTVVSSRIAAETKVPIVSADTLAVGTFEGVVPVRPGLVKRMEIGPIVFTNSPAIVMDAAFMRIKSTAVGVTGAGLQVDGIIGWDIIRQLDIVMDYQEGKITLNRPEQLNTNGTALQNLTWMGKPLVQVAKQPGGTFHFRLDTGAQASFLNAAIMEKAGVVAKAYGGRVFGFAETGQRTSRIVPSLTLDVGGRSLRLEGVIVYGPSLSGLVNSDGILGSDIGRFGKIRIDATNGLFSVGE
jgi:predicted aspartyl protease